VGLPVQTKNETSNNDYDILIELMDMELAQKQESVSELYPNGIPNVSDELKQAILKFTTKAHADIVKSEELDNEEGDNGCVVNKF